MKKSVAASGKRPFHCPSPTPITEQTAFAESHQWHSQGCVRGSISGDKSRQSGGAKCSELELGKSAAVTNEPAIPTTAPTKGHAATKYITPAETAQQRLPKVGL